MQLGIEVGLGPGNFVIDGEPATPKKGHSLHPIFGRCLFWPNGWMNQDAILYGSRPRPRHIVIDGDPALPAKGAQQPPLFGACLLWPRSPISATAELLLIFDSPLPFHLWKLELVKLVTLNLV